MTNTLFNCKVLSVASAHSAVVLPSHHFTSVDNTLEVDAATTPLAQLAIVGVPAPPLQLQLVGNDVWKAIPVTLEAWAAHGGLGPAMKHVTTFTDVLANPILLAPWDRPQPLAALSNAVTQVVVLWDRCPPHLLTSTTCKLPVLIGVGHYQLTAPLTLGHTVFITCSRPVLTPSPITGFTLKC